MNTDNKPIYDLTFQTIHLKEYDNVLEVGFGNGHHFEELFSIKYKINLYGIDYSADMVNQVAAGNKRLLIPDG